MTTARKLGWVWLALGVVLGVWAIAHAEPRVAGVAAVLCFLGAALLAVRRP